MIDDLTPATKKPGSKRRLKHYRMNRRVDIEVLSDSWPASTAPPSGLVAAVQSYPSQVDILASILFLGLWPRSPVTHGFSLSDCWAWLRYFPALATTPDLRLRDE